MSNNNMKRDKKDVEHVLVRDIGSLFSGRQNRYSGYRLVQGQWVARGNCHG